MKKWKIPDFLGILITFLTLFVVVSLFLASIVPVFVGLAEDSKTYINNTAKILELQAQNDFPIIDRLPLNLGAVVRKELNIEAVRGFVMDSNRSQFIMNGLVGNIDTVRNFIQGSFGQLSALSLSFASGVTTAVTTFFLFILLTFFIILERRPFLRWFFAILPADLGSYFRSRQRTISQAIHAWLR